MRLVVQQLSVILMVCLSPLTDQLGREHCENVGEKPQKCQSCPQTENQAGETKLRIILQTKKKVMVQMILKHFKTHKNYLVCQKDLGHTNMIFINFWATGQAMKSVNVLNDLVSLDSGKRVYRKQSGPLRKQTPLHVLGLLSQPRTWDLRFYIGSQLTSVCS